MYCEAAQKECKYLDQLERLKEETVVRRAAGDLMDADVASSVEEGLSEATGSSVASCEDDYCGLVALAVALTVVQAADEIGMVENGKD